MNKNSRDSQVDVNIDAPESQRGPNAQRNRARRLRQRRRRAAMRVNSNQQTKQTKNSTTPGPRPVAEEKEKLSLSPCAMAYAQALINPFMAPKEPPCIPDTHAVQSTKFHVWTKGVFYAGTLGTGYVLLDPWLLVANDTGFGITNVEDVAGVATTAAYTASYIQTVGTFSTTFQMPIYSNSPYTFAQLNSTHPMLSRFRLVAAGIKGQFVGSTLNNAGQFVCIRSTSNQTLPNNLTIGEAYAMENTSMLPLSKKSEAVVLYAPATPEDYTYDTIASHDPNESGTDYHCMCLAVAGCEVGTPVFFECWAHFELIGTPQRSESHTDLIGTSVVHNATNRTKLNGTFAGAVSSFAAALSGSPKSQNQTSYTSRRGLTRAIPSSEIASTVGSLAGAGLQLASMLL